MMRLLTGLLIGLAAWVDAAGQDADFLDPRSRVSIDASSRIPDHLSQIAGPPPDARPYEGTLDSRRIYRIDANPEAGFHWPYFLSIPEIIPPGISILIEPNNDGLWGAPSETHEYWALIRNEQLSVDLGRELNTPVLTPVFPRPLVDDGSGNLYIHALTRAAITHEDPRYARPDLQILAMLDDARSKLAADGHAVGSDALFWGFSAAADFVTRMAVLHPGRVRAVAGGGMGGLPILPLETYRGEPLTYPVGVGDIKSVAGRALDAAALRDTPVLLFQGGADENDSIEEPPFRCDDFASDSYNCEQALWVNEVFGASTVQRVPGVSAIYGDFGMTDFKFLVLPGIEHWTPKSMQAAIRHFYACVLAGATGCAASVEVPDLTRALEEQAVRRR